MEPKSLDSLRKDYTEARNAAVASVTSIAPEVIATTRVVVRAVVLYLSLYAAISLQTAMAEQMREIE